MGLEGFREAVMNDLGTLSEQLRFTKISAIDTEFSKVDHNKTEELEKIIRDLLIERRSLEDAKQDLLKLYEKLKDEMPSYRQVLLSYLINSL